MVIVTFQVGFIYLTWGECDWDCDISLHLALPLNSVFFQNKLRKSLKLSCLCVWLICLLVNLAGCHWLTRCFVSFVFVHWLVWYILVCMFLNGFVDQLPSLNTISFISFHRGLGRVRQWGRDGHCPFVKLTPRKGRFVTPSPPPTTTFSFSFLEVGW